MLHGGTPWRLLRLTDAGAVLATRLLAGDPVTTPAAAALASRLVLAGLAHPAPPGGHHADIEVVVPAHDRVDALDRTLAGLGRLPTVVVDDASADADGLRRTADRHGARVVRLERNRGPAAARNAGLAATTAALVAFVDSDSCVDPERLQALAAHLDWAAVAAAAPRVRPRSAAAGTFRRAADLVSPLDLGERPGAARPGGRVGYVPATVLLARRAALVAVGGFDETLRYGEDVDLVWRLHDAGWQVRYDPRIVVEHEEPADVWSWCARRFRYGESAGALARRHGRRVSGPALAVVVAPAVLPARTRGALPAATAVRTGAAAVAATAAGLGRWAAPLWWPTAGLAPRRARIAAGAVVAGGLTLSWWRRGREAQPAAYLAARTVDAVTYGAGVWAGCARARTLLPVLPRVTSGPPPSSP